MELPGTTLVQVLVIVAALAASAGAGAYITDLRWQHTWDAHVALDAKALKAATDAARADERRAAALSHDTGAKQAVTQNREAAVARTIQKEVIRHVHDEVVRPCVSYGLVRVLDAAARGISPSDLELPPGVSDDACTPLGNADLGRSVSSNYAIARANAAQLNGLIEDVTARLAIANGATHD